MWGFQAAGAAPLVLGRPVERPETVATAIRIGDPGVVGRGPMAARDESGGLIEAVTDEEILAAYRDLARIEGVFCEPASAAGVAGVRQDGRRPAGSTRDATVVCRAHRSRPEGPAHAPSARSPRVHRGRARRWPPSADRPGMELTR